MWRILSQDRVAASWNGGLSAAPPRSTAVRAALRRPQPSPAVHGEGPRIDAEPGATGRKRSPVDGSETRSRPRQSAASTRADGTMMAAARRSAPSFGRTGSWLEAVDFAPLTGAHRSGALGDAEFRALRFRRRDRQRQAGDATSQVPTHRRRCRRPGRTPQAACSPTAVPRDREPTACKPTATGRPSYFWAGITTATWRRAVTTRPPTGSDSSSTSVARPTRAASRAAAAVGEGRHRHEREGREVQARHRQRRGQDNQAGNACIGQTARA